MVVVELCFAYFLHIILSAFSLSLYDKKYVEIAFSDTQKLVPCWLTRAIVQIFNPPHTYNSIYYYILFKKNLLLYSNKNKNKIYY